jgi:hypothetical protein
VESRDGHELVKLEGADAIQELHRVSLMLQSSGMARLSLSLHGSGDLADQSLSMASPFTD